MKQLIFIVPCLPLVMGYLLDLALGDPRKLPHPIRVFGWLIAVGEKTLNQSRKRFAKGALLTVGLVGAIFFFFWSLEKLLYMVHPTAALVLSTLFVFFGLANKSLIQEGSAVFEALHQQGIEAGRKRLSWIVGRDTSALTPQQIRIAVFETMAENLSDGVIAPLFYYLVLGMPGMMAYKMINTLDSMTGYRNERFEQFGKFAARLDDVANFVPARLTAWLMVLFAGSLRGLRFIFRHGHHHKSPNAGYPEAALAGILDVRFGGPNLYHGKMVEKPYIGARERLIRHEEFERVALLNHGVTLGMVVLVLLVKCLVGI